MKLTNNLIYSYAIALNEAFVDNTKEIDAKLLNKVDADTIYSKNEVNDLVNTKYLLYYKYIL